MKIKTKENIIGYQSMFNGVLNGKLLLEISNPKIDALETSVMISYYFVVIKKIVQPITEIEIDEEVQIFLFEKKYDMKATDIDSYLSYNKITSTDVGMKGYKNQVGEIIKRRVMAGTYGLPKSAWEILE